MTLLEKYRLRRNELARIRYAKLSEQERKDRNERTRMMRRLRVWSC